MPNTNEWLQALFGGAGRGVDLYLALRQAAQEREDSRKRFETTNKQRALELDAARLEREGEREAGRKQRTQDELTRQRERAEEVAFRQHGVERESKERARTEARQRALDILTPFERQGAAFDPSIYDALRAASAPGAGRRLAGTPEPDIKAAARQAGPNIGEAFAEAQRRSRPGLEGAAVRAPQPGVFKGVSYQPDTVTVAQPREPSAERGNVFSHIQQRVDLGAGLMERIVTRANEIEGADPNASNVPFTADLGAAAAERLLGHGAGSRVADRVRNVGASDEQQEYRGLREQFKHSLAVFFPRVSQALMENLGDSYWPVGGESDVARSAKRAARNDVLRMVRAVRAGRATPNQLAHTIAMHGGDVGQQFLAEALEVEDAAPAVVDGREVGVPRGQSGGGAPGRDYSRFLGRPR